MLEKTLGALAVGAASSISGSVTVATVTTRAAGIAGWLGFTTTSAVTLPVAGIVVAAAAVGYGVHKGVQWAQSQDN